MLYLNFFLLWSLLANVREKQKTVLPAAIETLSSHPASHVVKVFICGYSDMSFQVYTGDQHFKTGLGEANLTFIF